MGTTMSSIGLANKPPALPPVKIHNNNKVRNSHRNIPEIKYIFK